MVLTKVGYSLDSKRAIWGCEREHFFETWWDDVVPKSCPVCSLNCKGVKGKVSLPVKRKLRCFAEWESIEPLKPKVGYPPNFLEKLKQNLVVK